jgi:hypothetical protein
MRIFINYLAERYLNLKNILIALAGATLLGAGNLAIAGPDWQIIEHGRKINAERSQQAQAQQIVGCRQQLHKTATENGTTNECLGTTRKTN